MINNSTNSRDLAQCMATELKQFHFDKAGVKPGRVATISFPFAFGKK